jgi:hypothetical protein
MGARLPAAAADGSTYASRQSRADLLFLTTVFFMRTPFPRIAPTDSRVVQWDAQTTCV